MQEVIDALYRVFAAVPPDPGVGCCSHCVSEEQVAALHSYPLREFPAEPIHKLLAKGVSTWGDEAYFRHFPPRRRYAGGTRSGRALPDRLVGRHTDPLPAASAPGRALPDHHQGRMAGCTAVGGVAPGPPVAARAVRRRRGLRPPARPIAEWLGSGVPAALLTTAGDATDDPELRDHIVWALELLEHNY